MWWQVDENVVLVGCSDCVLGSSFGRLGVGVLTALSRISQSLRFRKQEILECTYPTRTCHTHFNFDPFPHISHSFRFSHLVPKITSPMLATSSSSVTSVQVENVTFPATVKAPGSNNSFFLGGAGVRGMEIEGKFVKFTAIGIYLQDNAAVPSLAVKWKGKTPHQLNESVEFFRDIVTGPFEKFMRVTMILPLTGQQYSEKVSENCVAIWKQMGVYTDAEAKAIEKFNSVFKNETFPPGSSILFTVSPKGSLVIGFSKDGFIPEVGSAVIENKLISEAVLESMIGKHGVSPAAKHSLATRLSELFKEGGDSGNGLHPPKDEKSDNRSSSPAKDEKSDNGSSHPTEDEKSAT